jgi:hypothetical protein
MRSQGLRGRGKHGWWSSREVVANQLIGDAVVPMGGPRPQLQENGDVACPQDCSQDGSVANSSQPTRRRAKRNRAQMDALDQLVEEQ